jgi:hypothetical protein
MAGRRGGYIHFVAVYEDGSEERFSESEYTFRSGDHVATIVAGELQRKGRLPPGKIISVRRSDSRFP